MCGSIIIQAVSGNASNVTWECCVLHMMHVIIIGDPFDTVTPPLGPRGLVVILGFPWLLGMLGNLPISPHTLPMGAKVSIDHMQSVLSQRRFSISKTQ